MYEKPNNMINLELARQNFKMWNDSLQTKDPKVVATLYSENNTFLPTLNGEFKQG